MSRLVLSSRLNMAQEKKSLLPTIKATADLNSKNRSSVVCHFKPFASQASSSKSSFLLASFLNQKCISLIVVFNSKM